MGNSCEVLGYFFPTCKNIIMYFKSDVFIQPSILKNRVNTVTDKD